MELKETGIKNLYVITPYLIKDDRGYFMETFNKNFFSKMSLQYDFVQDNESKSSYGTIRGLHLQTGNFSQAKLVRVLEGEVLDVAVDLRVNSDTFGKHFSVNLSSENKKQLLIPRGFAHGFSVLSETAVFAYKCDNFYSKESESGIRFDDSTLNIDWKIPLEKILISQKDRELKSFKEFRK